VRITNETNWRTADLRRVFSAVLARWNAREEARYQVPSKRLRRITLVNARWRGCSGRAFYDSGTMRLRLPKEAVSVRSVAWLFEHELAHCAGYAHDAHHGRKAMMGYINFGPKGSDAWERHYGFVGGLTIQKAQPKAPKPKPDRQAIGYQRTIEGIARWQAKAKRAATALKKLNQRKRYYEKVLAAKRKGRADEETNGTDN
jgi:hypothetical protein